MNTNQSELVIRDWPLGLWIVGIILAAVSLYNLDLDALMQRDVSQLLSAAAGAGGLLLLLLPSLLTVTADRANQMLTLRWRSALRSSQREIPFSQIEAVQLEVSGGGRSHDSDSGPSYRIVIVTKTGEVIPWRKYYSSGSAGKSRKIKQLREFTGAGGSDWGMGLSGSMREAGKMIQAAFQEQQEALTGSPVETQVTNGVRWQIQTAAMGGSAVTRWFSPDFCVPDGFVYVSQILEGQKMTSGLLGALSGVLFKQALSMYGFGSDDTPGLATAQVLGDLDPQIQKAFSVYTSAPHQARQVLNPRAAASLADWNRRYPLKTMQDRPIFVQLAVMFSPRGTYICSLGTMIPEAVEEMTRLGVELLTAQEAAVR